VAGHLEVVVGPMFSGKTDLLLERVEALEREGVRVETVRPAADTRSPEGQVASHSGRTHAATAVAQPAELAALDADALAIDELHFFPVTIISSIEDLLGRGVIVVAAGLDLDFGRRPFEVTASLARVADRVTELRGRCGVCGGESTVTQRLVDGTPAPLDDEVLRPGAGDLYEPRCADCWERERGVVASASGTVRRPA
jgi:thymidine kinase